MASADFKQAASISRADRDALDLGGGFVEEGVSTRQPKGEHE